jgi:outer membrane protein assembly factor BamB
MMKGLILLRHSSFLVRYSILGFSLCILCLFGEFSSLPAADWPQFIGPDRNGISAETGLLTSWPDKGPPMLWEKSIGEGYSGPVVAGNRLIIFHRVENEDVVECLDAVTGKGHWKFAYATEYRDNFGKGDGPRATPLIVAGRVFTLGPQGELHCLDLSTGKKAWVHFLAKEYELPDNFFGIGTSPILENDLVLVNVGPPGGGVLAFNRETGKEAWRAKCEPASYSSPVAATIDGTRHVFFFTMNGLVSVDPKNGDIRFQKPWRSRIRASVTAATPLVIKDQVFISASYGTGAILLRVGKDDGEEIWKADDVMSNHYNTCIHKDGLLYGCDGRQEAGAQLRCVELATGRVRWTQAGFGCANMILADGKLIALSEDGDLILLEPSPESYKELARVHVLSRPSRAPLALADGRLYARDDHKLICWNLKK